MEIHKEYDFFISHASEDKEIFVRKLAEELSKLHYKVWYDELSLKLGDSLMQGISEGIKNSSYGIIVLSKNFFKKRWTRKELESLISKEVITNSDLILPIWLNVNQLDVYNFSPLLVDKLAISVVDSNNMQSVVSKIIEKTGVSTITENTLEEKIDYLKKCDKYERKKYLLDMEARIKNLYHFQEAWYHTEIKEDEILDEIEVELLYIQKLKELERRYDIPSGVWYNDELFPDNSMNDLIKLSKKWVNRRLSYEEAYEFYFLMEEYLDIDYHFILYGYPHAALKSADIMELSKRGLFEIGVLKDIDIESKRITSDRIWTKYDY